MQWDPVMLGGLGAIPNDKASDFYQGIHRYLRESGLDGVKVDAQGAMGTFGEGNGGGPELVRHFTSAMEGSVSDNFGASHCINCMCHSTENMYNYKLTTMARVSDDFYPRDTPSHTYHIAAVAFNSVFMGEIVNAVRFTIIRVDFLLLL